MSPLAYTLAAEELCQFLVKLWQPSSEQLWGQSPEGCHWTVGLIVHVIDLTQQDQPRPPLLPIRTRTFVPTWLCTTPKIWPNLLLCTTLNPSGTQNLLASKPSIFSLCSASSLLLCSHWNLTLPKVTASHEASSNGSSFLSNTSCLARPYWWLDAPCEIYAYLTHRHTLKITPLHLFHKLIALMYW